MKLFPILLAIVVVAQAIYASDAPVPKPGQVVHEGLPEPVASFVKALVDLTKSRDTEYLRTINLAAIACAQLFNTHVTGITKIISDHREAVFALLNPVLVVVPAVLPTMKSVVLAVQVFVQSLTDGGSADRDVLLKNIVSTAILMENHVGAAVDYLKSISTDADVLSIGLTIMMSGILTCTLQILINVKDTLPQLLAPVIHTLDSIIAGLTKGVKILVALVLDIVQNSIHGVDSTLSIMESLNKLDEVLEGLSKTIDVHAV